MIWYSASPSSGGGSDWLRWRTASCARSCWPISGAGGARCNVRPPEPLFDGRERFLGRQLHLGLVLESVIRLYDLGERLLPSMVVFWILPDSSVVPTPGPLLVGLGELVLRSLRSLQLLLPAVDVRWPLLRRYWRRAGRGWPAGPHRLASARHWLQLLCLAPRSWPSAPVSRPALPHPAVRLRTRSVGRSR